jgi:hypothetical protein
MQPQPGKNGKRLNPIRAKAGAAWGAEIERQALSPDPEERRAAYQAIRALGCLPPEAGFYLVGHTIEEIAEQHIEEALEAGPLRAIIDRILDLKRALGLEPDEDWPPGGEPDEWRPLAAAFHEAVERTRAALFRHLADPEMAELFLNDRPEFDRRMEAGRQYLFGPLR